jgi:hypothetical protein
MPNWVIIPRATGTRLAFQTLPPWALAWNLGRGDGAASGRMAESPALFAQPERTLNTTIAGQLFLMRIPFSRFATVFPRLPG